MLTRERIVELMAINAHDRMPYIEVADRIFAEMEEPLAVLADRKWRRLTINCRIDRRWHISITDKRGENITHFYSNSYAEAEAKAREFLATLPDKGGK